MDWDHCCVPNDSGNREKRESREVIKMNWNGKLIGCMGQGQEIPRFLVQCVDWDGEWALGPGGGILFCPCGIWAIGELAQEGWK